MIRPFPWLIYRPFYTDASCPAFGEKRKKGDLPEAWKKLCGSEKLYPENYRLFAVRAQYYTAAGKFKEAELQIKQGLKLVQNAKMASELYWVRANFYLKQEKYEAALADLENVLQSLNNGYLEIQTFYAAYASVLYHTGQYARALEAAQKILSYAPENSDIQKIAGSLTDRK